MTTEVAIKVTEPDNITKYDANAYILTKINEGMESMRTSMMETIVQQVTTNLRAVIVTDIVTEATAQISDNIEKKSATVMSNNITTLDKIVDNHINGFPKRSEFIPCLMLKC